MVDEWVAMTAVARAVASAERWADATGQKRVVEWAVSKAACWAVMSVIARAGLKVVWKAVLSADLRAAWWVDLLVVVKVAH